MKVGLYDQDMMLAATYYQALERVAGVVVEYFDSITDPALRKCGVVIADPYPSTTKDWIASFRKYNKDIPLILVSNSPDLLSGSCGDSCIAITKPVTSKDLVHLIRYIAVGSPANVLPLAIDGKGRH